MRRWLFPLLVQELAGGRLGAENYIPTNRRTCEEMAWRMQTDLVEETSWDINHPFWVDWFKTKEVERGELTRVAGVFYYTPQLLGMIDTLVQEVGQDMVNEPTSGKDKMEEAVKWWMVPGRMDAFDEAMEDMWKFD